MFFKTIILVVAAVSCVRFYIASVRKRELQRRSPSTTCRLAVFLGSGGHTREALSLLSTLDFNRYTPRTYVVSEGDTFSADKALDLEKAKTAGEYRLLTIPRARRVHQPLWTSVPTTINSFFHCVYHVTLAHAPFADVLILNGPGTCIALCGSVYLNRFLGLSSPTLIYVESFARVQSLSLTGKLLRPFVDRQVSSEYSPLHHSSHPCQQICRPMARVAGRQWETELSRLARVTSRFDGLPLDFDV